MAKLSIIICVYNTEKKYLSECLKSIFDQTIKDIEVIIVDDGSSYDYANIITKFDKIKYYKTENQGTLKARLYGMNQATAPYVCFVDSDDIVSFCYFEAMLTKSESENIDICLNDWAFKTERSSYYCENDSTINSNFTIEKEQIIKRFFQQRGREHSYYVLWNKIFKKEVLDYCYAEIEKLNIKQKLVFAEDVLINYFAFKKAEKIANVHLGYYFYRIHGGQQIDATSEDKFKNHIESMTLVFDIMQDDLIHADKFSNFESDFLDWKNLLCTNNYLAAKRGGFKELVPLIREKYRLEKIQRLPKGYDKAYGKQRVLPENILEIDTQLKKVYYSNKHLKIYVKNNSYAHLSLLKMQRYFGKRFKITSYKKQANFIFSNEKLSRKQLILHSEFMQKIGAILFPKGSKLRKFLKSKL